MIKYIFLSYFFPILTKCYQITHLPNYEVETEDGEIHDVASDYYPIFDTMIKNIFKSDKINEISNNNDRRKLLGETELDAEAVPGEDSFYPEETAGEPANISPNTFEFQCIQCGVENVCHNRGRDYIHNGRPTEWVLTAAHCLRYGKNRQHVKDIKLMKVILGDFDLKAEGETCLEVKKLKVANFIIHEGYLSIKNSKGQAINRENDIALLELSEEVDLGMYTPACLAEKGEKGEPPFYVTGWGEGTNEGNKKLHQINLEQIQVEQMLQEEVGQMIVNINDEGKSSGGGDSGGPLTYIRHGHHVLVGTVLGSNSRSGREKGRSSYFAQIAFYRDWIEKNMKDPKFCRNGPRPFRSVL